jgi:hypothetical protein
MTSMTINQSAGKQVIVYLSGSKTSFRCNVRDERGPCNGNVFTRVGPDRVRCNSCRTVWNTDVPEPWDK